MTIVSIISFYLLTRGIKLISHLVLDLFINTKIKNRTNGLSDFSHVLVNSVDDHDGDGDDDDDDLEIMMDGNECIREFRDLYCTRG